MPIRVVSFDMEGTLVDHAYSKQIWEGDIPALYAEAHGLHLEEARKKVLAEYAEVGEGQPEWYDVGYWWKRLGLPHYWRDLPKRRKAECNVYPDVPSALARLGKRYPLIVCSNTIREFLKIQLECIDYPFSRSSPPPLTSEPSRRHPTSTSESVRYSRLSRRSLHMSETMPSSTTERLNSSGSRPSTSTGRGS
jgi:putative hydrolase of the HAD superfamily